MTVVEGRTDLWRTLAGRGPEHPLPADPDLWRAVAERLNRARARPRLRAGVEEVEHAALRGGSYVMLRSPDRLAAYVRLTPEEVALARLMDGSRTVAQLVGEFARATGRLAPDQVGRVVADLAGARMLDELPVDAFAPLAAARRRPWPLKVGRTLVAFAAGRRMVLANPDRLAGFAYRVGGRLLFTRVGTFLMAAVSVWGIALFARTWAGGARQATVADGSYAAGALVLLGLNALGLLVHETGHALGVKHAGRRAPAVGVMCYFGIPSAYVDTTDMWMASRRHRLVATAAGPGFTIAFAGAVQVLALWHPSLGAVAFPLGFALYLNSLFNLNPLMALDGYYLVMDWLEVPNLRPRAVVLIARSVRRPALLRAAHSGEDRLVARYAVLSLLWMVAFLAVMTRSYKDRLRGMVAGLWSTGVGGRLLLVTLVGLLISPVAYLLLSWLGRRPAAARESWRRRHHAADQPRRLDALRDSRLGGLPAASLEALASAARWARVRRGGELVAAGAAVPHVLVVVDGELEGRRPGDPSGSVRGRAGAGDVVGAANAVADRPSSLAWSAVGTRVLRIPAAAFVAELGTTASADVDTAEVETLLERTPALASLPPEDRAVLAAQLRPVDLDPDRQFRLTGSAAAIVGDGVVVDDAGGEHRVGDVVGPTAGDATVATARTRARVWPLTVAGSLAASLAAAAVPTVAGTGSEAPHAGVHGDRHGALVLPWGAPPDGDDAVDDELDRRFRRLLAMLALIVALLVWAAVPAGTAWSETPSETAILSVRSGVVDAIVNGDPQVLVEGDELLVRRGDEVAPRRRSVGVLTFRGGAQVLVCPRSDALVGALGASTRTLPVKTSADLVVRSGRVIADTGVTSPDFEPLALGLGLRHGRWARNDGDALLGATSRGVAVGRGVVLLDGQLVEPTGRVPDCGTGAGEGDDEKTTTGESGEADETTTTSSSMVGTGDPTTTLAPDGGGDPVDGTTTTLPSGGAGPTTSAPPDMTTTTTTSATTSTAATTTTTTVPITAVTRPPTTTTAPPRTTTTAPLRTTSTTRPRG